MREIFKADFFVGNRKRLRELFTGTAPIVITANGLLQRAADGSYPFQQDANFWYLTGISEPDMVFVMDRDREYLITSNQSDYQDIFEGSLDNTKLMKLSGVKTILDHKEGWKQLGARLKRTKHVATLAASATYIQPYGMYANPARRQLIDAMKELNPSLELLDLKPHLARMRMIKQSLEVQAIQHAIDITATTLKAITRPGRLEKYKYEYEIEGDITRGFRARGASGHAFTPIVAGGRRATIIHNMSNDAALDPSELLVMDIGAEANHYAADITRSVSLNGRPSRRQQAVYGAVAEVQDFAFDLLKPGLIIKDFELEVEHFMGEKLRELGLIKTIERDQVRRYFPHATSHFLGLDPHDAGDYQRPLESGVVMTVEPGIYIPNESIGIRIEDDVLITTDGYRNLSAKLARTL